MSRRSRQMDQLYGESISIQVYERLQDLDSELNTLIQTIAYDIFWARAGLSLKQKSLVTILTLFALQKEEQTRIHLNGFFNSGGSLSEVNHFLSSIQDILGQTIYNKTLQIVKQVVHESRIKMLQETTYGKLDTIHAVIVVYAAKADMQNLKNSIQSFLDHGGDVETLRSTFIHMIVYAGFPTSMNSFAVLKQFIDL